MKRLETPQLILRDWAEEDAKDLHRYAKDPETGPAAGWKPHENMEESREIAKMFIREGNVWALEEKASGRVIGSLGLHKDEKRPGVPGVKMVGYVLAKEFWGQERMTEAVKEAFLPEAAFFDHPPGTVVPRKMINRQHSESFFLKGVPHGSLRESFVRFDGTLMDEVCCSLTVEEWKEGRGC